MSERTFVITGASSGIGAALARRLAGRPGAVLGLVGRNEERLEAVATTCRAAGAVVTMALLDARDREGLGTWLSGFDAANPVDGIIANAGVSAGSLPGGHPERDSQTYDVFEVNLGGALNLVVPMVPRMQARGRGRIVLVSSLAAFAPLPDAAAYSASKAALLTYGLALRQGLRRDGVAVNVVCPGFVTTPMSASVRGWKPLEMSADAAALRIEAGLDRNRAVIAFPWPLALACRMVPLVPEPMLARAMRLFRL